MDFIRKLITYECPVLNTKDRKGITGYIDFIQEKELGQNAVMKGSDCIGRPFIVLKTEFVLFDGTTIPFFSTFFQRYIDEKFLWHCCGHDGEIMMHTEGGMRVEQFEFLTQLLNEKVVDIDPELHIIKRMRLNYYIEDVEGQAQAQAQPQAQAEAQADNTDTEDKKKGLPIQIRLRENSIKKNYIINPRFVF